MDVCFRVEYKKYLLLQNSGSCASFYDKYLIILVTISDFCENLICYFLTNKFLLSTLRYVTRVYFCIICKSSIYKVIGERPAF